MCLIYKAVGDAQRQLRGGKKGILTHNTNSGQLRTRVRKNWLPLVLGPALAYGGMHSKGSALQ